MAITIIIVIARGAKCQINHAINSVLHSHLVWRVSSLGGPRGERRGARGGEMGIELCAVLVPFSLCRLTNSSWTVNNVQNDVLSMPIEMATVR